MNETIMKARHYEDFAVFPILDLDQLKDFQEEWNRIYNADPEAHLFVSWDWMFNWLSINQDRWFVLAMRDKLTGEVISFFPLSRTVKQPAMKLIRLFSMGGLPLSMYNDILCAPERKAEIMAAWAVYLKGDSSWDKIRFKGIMDPEFRIFTQEFDQKGFSISWYPGVDSLSIALPDTWETYYNKVLGRSTRKTFTRLANKIDASDITLHEVSDNSCNEDIDSLLNLWKKKWGSIKMIDEYRIMLQRMYECGRIWLFLYKEGKVDVSGQLCLVDREKGVVYALITAYHPDYSALSPGNIIGLVSLKKAINEGFNKYDFLIGNDKYKRTLGATEKEIINLTIERTNFRTKQARFLKSLSSLLKLK
jgi:hypothetical protein